MSIKKIIALIFGLLVVGTICLVIGLIGVRYWQITRKQAARPTLKIVSPGLHETVSVANILMVQAAAIAQGSPVTIFQFYADGFLAGEQRGPAESLLGVWDWSPRSAGIHTLSFVAYNQQGDANMASLEVTAVPAADRDGDGVPDAQDGCPDEAGPAASKGCLLADDRDHDGIPDIKDTCPDEAGDVEDGGCPVTSIPDRDRDGVPDSMDRCPDISGVPEWAGCPAEAWVTDRDGDGIPDFLDTCPDDSGVLESDGCPATASSDRDGDGVADEADACPDVAGPAESSGCPVTADRDGDGIPDDRDLCPDEAGLEELGGCLPDEGLTDTDGDGVIDEFDDCVDVPGPLENGGCPLPEDRDSDGIPDSDDNCPDLPGPEWNEGCPLIHIPAIAMEPFIPIPFDTCELFPSTCDTDGDGVSNDVDVCPDQAGLVLNSGCPIYPQDQDGDGVLDEYDNCPTEVGDPANMGCPVANDLDGDGVSFEFDACPDVPGPPENNGCPRVGRNTDIEIELLSLNTNPGWAGTYCYVKFTGAPLMLRIPETGLLGSISESSWSLPDDRSSTTVTVPENSFLNFQALCYGMTFDPSILPQSLGNVVRNHGYEAWDNQLRTGRGEGSGGWFEVTYRLCRGSCP